MRVGETETKRERTFGPRDKVMGLCESERNLFYWRCGLEH